MVEIRNGCEILWKQFVANSYLYSWRCLSYNILQRGVQSHWGLNREQTDENRPFFVIECHERWMEVDRELHDSLTAGVVCGNLRKGRWDQLSKQGDFSTTGDSYACPYYLYSRSLSFFPHSAAVSTFLLIRSENNKEGERKRRRDSEQTERGRKFSLFKECGQGVLLAK